MFANTGRFDMLSQGLREMYPNLSLQDANDLTWRGLYNTPSFSNLAPAERDRIIQRNLDFKNRTNGTGTPC